MSRALQTYLSRGYAPAPAEAPGAVTVTTRDPIPAELARLGRRDGTGAITLVLAPAEASPAEPRRAPRDMIAEANAAQAVESERRRAEALSSGGAVVVKTPGGLYRSIDPASLSPLEKMELGTHLGHGRVRS